ncbi:hypothetical protein SteCoe_34476 [Stentor coeruleus]|uniref:Lysosomal dipeptide transporter MFSD1 n=1 Tax=Stentor coeruleus TaxID=5963 RepID=A0A1R2AUL9_9CILI|nr:hypothetical protein SteCoe_34476 [Stentor coeruleus]
MSIISDSDTEFFLGKSLNASIQLLPSNPQNPPRIRYLIILLAYVLCLGSYFIYDNPAALQTQLQHTLGIDSIKYNLFYSVYSFPNIIIPILGGYLVDRIGNRNCNIVFTLLILLGQALFTFSVIIDNYPMALAGRCLFGIGGESLNISQYNVIIGWAHAKEVSFVLGLAATLNRLSTAANDNAIPIIQEKTSLGFSLCIGVILCGISFMSAIILAWLDKNKSRFILENKKIEDEKFRIKDVREFGTSFWLLSFNACFLYCAIYCFNNVGSNYFQERFGYSTVESGHILSITFIVCVVLCPINGYILDKYGYRIYHIILSSFLATLSHVLFFATPSSKKPLAPIFYMFLLGLSFSLASAVIWSSISSVIKKGSGTAYGIILSLFNAGLVVFPPSIGALKDHTNRDHGYYWVSFELIILGMLAIVTSVLLYVFNKREGGSLCHGTNRISIELKEITKC